MYASTCVSDQVKVDGQGLGVLARKCNLLKKQVCCMTSAGQCFEFMWCVWAWVWEGRMLGGVEGTTSTKQPQARLLCSKVQSDRHIVPSCEAGS